jgi:tetratricopeptide (TPR) repeat protein
VADQIRGLALSGQNKFNESIQVLQNAAQSAPEAVQPLAVLVRTYVRARKFDEAEAFLTGVLKANPNNTQASVLRAGVQLARNAPDQAIATLKGAIERSPGDANAHLALADVYRQRGQMDQALATAEAGLKAQPNHFGLSLATAAVYEAKQDFDRAIGTYEALLKQHPDSLIVANNLASLLANHRSDEASLEKAQQLGVVLRNSTLPHFNDTLGWLSYLRGDYNSAAQLLEKAAEALPNLAEVRYHLGLSYRKGSNEAKAREELQRADALEKDQTWLKERIQAALKDGA